MELTPRVRGQDQHAIVGAKRCPGVADEFIAVEIGGERGVQAVAGDDLGEGGQPAGERFQQLAQRPGFDNHFGHASALAWNSQELDVHRLVYCPSFRLQPEAT